MENNKKITFVNEAAKTRLKAIKEVYAGSTQKDVAKKYGVDNTTISDWIKMYEEGGAERLNVPLKPRPKHELSLEQLTEALSSVDEKYRKRIEILLDLVNSGGKLNETAAKHSITPQGLAKIRREYLAGKFANPE